MPGKIETEIKRERSQSNTLVYVELGIEPWDFYMSCVLPTQLFTVKNFISLLVV